MQRLAVANAQLGDADVAPVRPPRERHRLAVEEQLHGRMRHEASPAGKPPSSSGFNSPTPWALTSTDATLPRASSAIGEDGRIVDRPETRQNERRP